MWKESDTRVIVRSKVRSATRWSSRNAAVELHRELPKTAPAPAPAPEKAASAAPKLTSEIIFHAIAHTSRAPRSRREIPDGLPVEAHRPRASWAIDLKTAPGSCKPGVHATPDVTMELSDADFMAMSSEPDGMKLAMKLYMGGKAEDRRQRDGVGRSSATS